MFQKFPCRWFVSPEKSKSKSRQMFGLGLSMFPSKMHYKSKETKYNYEHFLDKLAFLNKIK